MVNRDFIKQLRGLGFTISTAELIDASRVASISRNLHELRTGVRGIYCKSLTEQKIFDILFEIHVTHSVDFEETAKKFKEEIAVMIQEGDRPSVDSQIDPVRLGLGLLVEQLIRGIQSDYKLALKKLFTEGEQSAAHHILLRYLMPSSNTFSDVLQKRDSVMQNIESNLNEAFPEYADSAIQALNAALYKEIRGVMDSSERMGLSSSVSTLSIEDRPIIEIENSVELQHALKMFAKSIVSKRRKMKASKKKLDMRRTIRENIQRGGILIKQVRRNRVKSKPRLLILTDVSPSTMHATKLFLSIIQMIKSLFADVRYYEFIGSLIDVTTEVRRAESIPNVIDRVVKKWEEKKTGKDSSDYQQAFKEFIYIAEPYLNRNYTVIILGDCRDWLGSWKNGVPMSAQLIHEIAEKTKGAYILNPENQELWNRGDSVVNHYRRNGAKILETKTLKQLALNLESIL